MDQAEPLLLPERQRPPEVVAPVARAGVLDDPLSPHRGARAFVVADLGELAQVEPAQLRQGEGAVRRRGLDAGELVRPDLERPAQPARVGRTEIVREAGGGVPDVGLALQRAYGRQLRRVEAVGRGSAAAAVRDADGLQRVAVLVRRQRQRVRDPRVRGRRSRTQVQVVLDADSLAVENQEHRVRVAGARLETAHVRGAPASRQQPDAPPPGVQLVDLVAQQPALGGAPGLAPLPGVEIRRPDIVRRRRLAEAAEPDAGEVLAGARGAHAGVEPRDRLHRRLVKGRVGGDRGAAGVGRGERGEVLDIELLHAPEAAELALDRVEAALVICVGRGERRAAPGVTHRHPPHHVHGERERAGPRPPGEPVGERELRRGGVLELGLQSEVVGGPGEQMRLAAAHQVDVAQRAGRVRRERRGPHEAGGADPEQVGGLHGGDVVDAREALEPVGGAPAVPRPVEVQVHAAVAQVDEVDGARAVDVGEQHAALVEAVGCVEPRRVVHRDLGAEAAVTEAGPIADRPVADAHEVAQPVAGHVRQVHGAGAVGEHQARAALLVERLRSGLRRAEPRLAERRIPAQDVVLGDQDVRAAVTGQVHEAQVRIGPVDRRQRVERDQRLPTGGRACKETRCGIGEARDVQASVAG